MKLLEGIKIIDFTRLLPGPLATNLLAKMGAEVIKIESPKRMDYVRNQLQRSDGTSVLFEQLNYNKEIKIIDYESHEGKKEVLELINSADALIEQFRPGAMQSWGFGYEDLKKNNKGIVYISLTGYDKNSLNKNTAGHDLNYLAYSGLISLMKDENGKPCISGTQFADISAAYCCIISLQAALIRKLKTGKGSHLNPNMADAVLPYLTIPYCFHLSKIDHRKYNLLNGKTTVNYTTYCCSDNKWIAVAAFEIKFWNRICECIERPDLKRTNHFELMNDQIDKQEIETIFKSKSRDEWMNIFKDKDVCVSPVLEIEELEGHPFHIANNTFVEDQNIKTIKSPF